MAIKKNAALKELEAQLKKEDDLLDEVSKRHPAVKVLMLKVPLNDEYTKFTYGFLKYPNRTDVSIAMTMQNTDPLRGKQVVMESNWLEGDRRLIDDDELFLSACTALDSVLSIRQAIVKKNWTIGE